MEHSKYIGKTLKEFIDDIEDIGMVYYIVVTPYETLSLSELIEVLDVYDYLKKDKNKYLDLVIESISDLCPDYTHWIRAKRRKN